MLDTLATNGPMRSAFAANAATARQTSRMGSSLLACLDEARSHAVRAKSGAEAGIPQSDYWSVLARTASCCFVRISKCFDSASCWLMSPRTGEFVSFSLAKSRSSRSGGCQHTWRRLSPKSMINFNWSARCNYCDVTETQCRFSPSISACLIRPSGSISMR